MGCDTSALENRGNLAFTSAGLSLQLQTTGLGQKANKAQQPRSASNAEGRNRARWLLRSVTSGPQGRKKPLPGTRRGGAGEVGLERREDCFAQPSVLGIQSWLWIAVSQRGPQAAGSCGHGLRPGLLPSRGARAHIPGEPAAVRTLPGGHLPAHLRAGHHHSRSQVPRGGGRTIRAPKCRSDEEAQGHCSFCKQETQEGGQEEAVEEAAFTARHEGLEGSPPGAQGLRWLACPVTREIWTIMTAPRPQQADHHFFLLPS